MLHERHPAAVPVKTTLAIEKRTLIDPEHTQQGLIRPHGGARLMPFVATIRYAAPRPDGAVAIRVGDEPLKEGE
ncbi:hypothetical protein ACFW1A_09135 [Kitasatospora sp. NPDC058965]|uniref:hypothetical protein n=1 Tax=Kitasatospora sp. NPDC058965 TaxID=3346682 RepID=UPI0036763943